MNNMANMTNMGAMGGPVGGPMPMMNNGAMPPQNGPRQMQVTNDNRSQLNTYIYEYFLRSGMYECARVILNSDAQVQVKKDSPGGRRDENGNLMGNGLGGDDMDTDSKDDIDSKRPDDLPPPAVPQPYPESCFLFEWFCLFWDIQSHAQKGKGTSGSINQYVQHTQTNQSRIRQAQQQEMLHSMRPEFRQQMQQRLMMQNNNMMRPGNNMLQKAAMHNQPQMQQMMQKGQMQGNPADMDGNRVRPASPGGADNAQSPSKRPRLDGPAGFNQGGGGMMPNGRPMQGVPGQNTVGSGPHSSPDPPLLPRHSHPPPSTPPPPLSSPSHSSTPPALQGSYPQLRPATVQHRHLQSGFHVASLNPNHAQAFAHPNQAAQAKGIATYAANLQQHHGNQMSNKPMPTANVPQGQGSPMVGQGPDAIGAFYNQDMGPNGMRGGGPGANGQAAGGSNHALQDYQMQLMLLEQQNKKRLMMARQEQDMPQRDNGAPGPGGPPGAQAFQGGSPPGQRNGTSPNPADQIKRQNAQMHNAANMGSPMPEGAQSRSSPNPMNFMPNNIPGQPPNFFQNGNVKDNMEMNMVNAQLNGNMRPPSSHPNQPFNGQMTPQMMAARQAGQPGGQGGPPMQWQQGPNGPMGPQGGPQQQQVQGTPQQRAMPPPSAPGAAANAANSRNATSSPQTTTAQPPTPSAATKPAPKKKESKGAKNNKTAAQKKSNSNLNSGATPAADPAPEAEPPTPATPITPVPTTFNKGQNPAALQVVPNGQPPAPAPAAAPVPQHSDPNQGFSMDMSNEFSLEFANPGLSADVLDGFDFDSFLHDGAGDDGAGFDFTNAGAFSMEGEALGAD